MSTIVFKPATFRNVYFKEKYQAYFNELGKYDACIPKDFEDVYEKYVRDEDVLFPYLIASDGMIVGFIILQYVEEGCGIDPPLWYITEFYIEPEYRRKHIGFEAVKHFVDTRKSDFFLYILNHNEPAKQFWKSCFQKLGLEEIDRSDIKQEEDTQLHCLSVGAAPQKTKNKS